MLLHLFCWDDACCNSTCVEAVVNAVSIILALTWSSVFILKLFSETVNVFVKAPDLPPHINTLILKILMGRTPLSPHNHSKYIWHDLISKLFLEERS